MIQEILLNSIYPTDTLEIPEIKPWYNPNDFKLKETQKKGGDTLEEIELESIYLILACYCYLDNLNECKELIEQSDALLDKIKAKCE